MENSLIVTSRIQHYVKSYIKEHGIKQKYLAAEMGYEEKKFSQLINGRVPLSIDDLTNFCSYFKIPATTFIPFKNNVS